MSDIQEPLPWGKSSATVAVLEQLVADRLLPRNSVAGAPAWICPHPDETEPKPPQGYVVSFVRLHERGFGVPVSKFMRALTLHVRPTRKNFYISSKMMTNNAGWSRGWFYLRNFSGALPAFTNKVLRERPSK